jgi:hypothetical protein
MCGWTDGYVLCFVTIGYVYVQLKVQLDVLFICTEP